MAQRKGKTELRASARDGANTGAGTRGKEPCLGRDKGRCRAQGKCKGRRQGQRAAMRRSNVVLCICRVIWTNDVTKTKKGSCRVLTQDVTKVRKHGRKEGSQEDVEAAQGGPGRSPHHSPGLTLEDKDDSPEAFHLWKKGKFKAGRTPKDVGKSRLGRSWGGGEIERVYQGSIKLGKGRGVKVLSQPVSPSVSASVNQLTSISILGTREDIRRQW
ncbi:MAG: hypothetical protein FRX49_01874 [Trebouxia sp. A1-2]|nr:MAG: hypothetical protein FRX49_01874 [Trebouxia sp. A1-2]